MLHYFLWNWFIREISNGSSRIGPFVKRLRALQHFFRTIVIPCVRVIPSPPCSKRMVPSAHVAWPRATPAACATALAAAALLLLVRPVAAPAAAAAAAERAAELAPALETDEECAAGETACSLSALQRRAAGTSGSKGTADASAKQWLCGICLHVYDPVADGGGKPFEALPDTWYCPVCGASKSQYFSVVGKDGLKVWAHRPAAQVAALNTTAAIQDGASRPSVNASLLS